MEITLLNRFGQSDTEVGPGMKVEGRNESRGRDHSGEKRGREGAADAIIDFMRLMTDGSANKCQ